MLGRLDERHRLTAIQRHVELAAAHGRHGDALRRLTVACQAEPYHEARRLFAEIGNTAEVRTLDAVLEA